MGSSSAHARRRLARWVALCSVLGWGAAWADTCDPEQVFLKGDWGQAQFNVELADDPAEQAQGLMHRTEMPMSAGMYFVNPRPRRTSFWMRNTLIPLDMLFIDAQGVVQHIHENAVPLDETPIPSGGAVLTVLEINGGLAKQLGLAACDQMQHPSFSQTNAAWPC